MTASGVDVALPAVGRRPGGAETLGEDPDRDGAAVDELRAREFARLDALGQDPGGET